MKKKQQRGLIKMYYTVNKSPTGLYPIDIISLISQIAYSSALYSTALNVLSNGNFQPRNTG